ncbi:MAG: hypothetical protein ACR2L2_14565 [Acidobacteriota bacterium]
MMPPKGSTDQLTAGRNDIDVMEQDERASAAGSFQASIEVGTITRGTKHLGRDALAAKDSRQERDGAGLVARRIAGVDSKVFGQNLRALASEFLPIGRALGSQLRCNAERNQAAEKKVFPHGPSF